MASFSVGVEETNLSGDNKKHLSELVVSWVAENYPNEPLNELYKDVSCTRLPSTSLYNYLIQ